MPVPDFAHGIQISFLDSATRARMQSHAQAAAASTPASTNTAVAATGGPASDPPLTFDDLLDVANPLQHLLIPAGASPWPPQVPTIDGPIGKPH